MTFNTTVVLVFVGRGGRWHSGPVTKRAGGGQKSLKTTALNLPDIGIMVRVFANGPGDLGSIPGPVIPKTLKMVLDTSLLNTQHCKLRIKGKVDKSRERSSALSYSLV